MNKPVRIGILGPGKIVDRVSHDFKNISGGTITAIASRSYDRAREACQKYGVQTAYGDYESMARSKEVDLVYIATPHNFHCEQAVMLMEAGKHILCEKPMAINKRQTETMVACAKKNGVFLMEAMWTRFFPASEKIRKLISDGAIGQVTHVYADFASVIGYEPESRLFNPSLAGGALLDIGIYPVMAATMVLGYDPIEVQGVCHYAPSGVDMRSAIQLKYQSGATAQLISAMDALGESREIIYGTEGRINIPHFWHPTEFTLSRLKGDPVAYRFPDETEGHHHQFTHACDCIQKGICDSPVMSWDESIAVSKLFTDLRMKWNIVYPEEA